ncbi:uncharacterized protein EMH_0095460 [Eimeria mitis]|uniref:Polycystin cation channel PKD1/PKD2 domain-containing protein n=1 Tax=Eimeria mitis TaxID=44415 RepID=U6JSY6_9EIME|nr:uncharacterized protein EMH_0095460 [Eimeria mitis]CDJ27876.1 hypothetical protein, conserved [Eimeria mitis]
MVASVRSASFASRGDSSDGSEGSTPSSGYVEVGLSENTSLSFERNHSFLNWLLLLFLLGGTSICAGFFYYAVPLRHELTATVRTHLTTTPFKEGQSFSLNAYSGGWRSLSSFSRAVELRNIRVTAAIRPETTGYTIAAGAITTWADVEAWLLKVLAPTLYTGSLGGAVVVQMATLHLVKGSLTDNENPNTAKVIYKRLNFEAAEEKTVDFGQLLGGTYAVDATSTLESLSNEGWWGPLTTEATLTIRGRDGNGNECTAKVSFKQSASGLVKADVEVVSILFSGSAFAFAFSVLFFVAAICYCVVEWFAFKLTKSTRRGWVFVLRLLHALSGASIFFRVLDRSNVVFVNEFGGIIAVTVLLLLGASACNYILLGPRVPQFRTFLSSIFYTVCLSFGAPFIKSMPPVAFIVAAIGLLVVWAVFVPMVVAINIQSLSAVVKKVRAGERENLAVRGHTYVTISLAAALLYGMNGVGEFLGISRLVSELQERARLGEAEADAKMREERAEKERTSVSEAEDTAAVEYRKLAAAFIPFIVIFSLGICFLCDTPRVHREFSKAIEQMMQPFATSDPFTTRDANVAAPPVWMISRPECGTSSKSFPANQPQGIRRMLQISSVTSLSGVYDWLEQVLAGQILNAAFNSPSTTNAIPLANPGALLLLKRIDLECQSFESLAELYPVRRKYPVFRNWTTETFGGGKFQPNAERVYTVPVYFSGSDPPTTFVISASRSGIQTAGYKGRESLSLQQQPTQSLQTRRLSGTNDDSNLRSDVHWSAADFLEIYVGKTSMRTKMEYLRSQNFLDSQLLELEVLWLTYNGDSSMFALNKVVITMSQGGLKTSLGVTIVPSWHVHPLETGVRPEVIFIPLALICLLVYLYLSYKAAQKRKLYPLYLVLLDVPLAVAFACCCFFLLCMYNVAFDPGWTEEISSVLAGASAGNTGHVPKYVPGPVQPWRWLPGSASMPTRSQPPPSGESLLRFLRLQEHIEMLANYLLFCKICAGLLYVIAVIRFITMVPAIPEKMQGLRKLLSHLNAAKVQTACTLCTLFSTFLLFSLIGYCVLGGSYNGFSTYANAIVSCVMLTQSKWNFNSVITIPQQGRSIGWLFQVFSLVVCVFFFGFLNYIILSMIYVRYESLKAEEAAEMQSALEAKYGVVQRKRVPLMVNDTVILYFKAFVKCLSLQSWGISTGGEKPVNSEFVNLKDEFFMSLKELPLLEYISKALLSTQIVRLQQCLTDIEFLRAKHYLILHDLGVIAEQMRVLRHVTRRQGKYVAGVEAAIQHVNDQIDEVQARKAFISHYMQQDPMNARQRMGQQQLFDLGMDVGRQAARRAVVDPKAYVPEELLDLTSWEDPERQRIIEEQRLQHLKEGSAHPNVHAVRKRQLEEELSEAKSPAATSPKALTPRMGVAGLPTSPSAPPQQSVYHLPGDLPWNAIVTDANEETEGLAPLKQGESDTDDDDWDVLRQRFGGAHQGTFELRERGGDIVVVKPFPEPPAERLPIVSIPQPERRSPPKGVLFAEPEEAGRNEQQAPSPSPSPTAMASAVSSFFAEDPGPRPKTNAPEIAEQRAREEKAHERPPQVVHRKKPNRRASASLPTFEAGGQEYRMLPRNRRKKQ